MQSEWGNKLKMSLSLITLSVQGNYLNLNHKLGIKEILEMGDNYLSYITSATQHLYTGVTCLVANLSIIMYHLV